jgi:hypothetical protein
MQPDREGIRGGNQMFANDAVQHECTSRFGIEFTSSVIRNNGDKAVLIVAFDPYDYRGKRQFVEQDQGGILIRF